MQLLHAWFGLRKDRNMTFYCLLDECHLALLHLHYLVTKHKNFSGKKTKKLISSCVPHIINKKHNPNSVIMMISLLRIMCSFSLPLVKQRIFTQFSADTGRQKFRGRRRVCHIAFSVRFVFIRRMKNTSICFFLFHS